MILGYNTNGLAHHRLFDAVRLLAEIGYRSVAITIDHNALPPYAKNSPRQLARLRRLLERLGMRSTIETGARYLLDPRRKHQPTLLSPTAAERSRRLDFYRYAIHCAAELGSDCVSLFSGAVRGPLSAAGAWQRLADGVAQVLDYAASANVAVGLEPEPGMFIDTVAKFMELRQHLGDERLRLTLDVGHVHCLGEGPLPRIIARSASLLVNVHLEDMRAGVHEHLMFGEGEIDFRAVLGALHAAGYSGPIHVELSRHSHQGPLVARKALGFLQPILAEIAGGGPQPTSGG
jgi:sugar phosphate isomerase/epimerase